MINFQRVKNTGMVIGSGGFGNDREIASPTSRDRNDLQVIKLQLSRHQAPSNE